MKGARTGDGRCKRDAASFSAGASNATTGAPNVVPINDANEPPRECPEETCINYHIVADADNTHSPVNQILALGYIYVTLL